MAIAQHNALVRLQSSLLALSVGCAAVLGVGCRDNSQATPANANEAPANARVVTLTPSATEIVAALGATDRLVGVDSYSTYPTEVQNLPKVGDFLRPNFEVIATLAPDLVIADAVQGEIAQGLAAAGVRTLSLSMHTISDVRTGLTEVGTQLGLKEAATKAIFDIDEAIREATDTARKRSADGTRERVLVVVDRELGGLGNLVAAGPESYMDQLLHYIGADNVLADYQVRYPKLSAEQLLRAQPTVIIDLVASKDPQATLADWKLVPELPAVAKQRVYALQDSVYMSPGPRLGDALKRLSVLVYP